MTDAVDGELALEDGADQQPEHDSAVDPQRTDKIKRGKRKQDNESAIFWQNALSTEVGRREIWGILRELHPFESKIPTSPVGFPDERSTWMHLSLQLVGQRLFQRLYVQHPQLVLLMQAENDSQFPKPVK